GRDRLGRQSRAHSSARRELAVNAPPKRGRRRQGPPPVQGTQDQEAGGSAASGTRSRSRRAQVEVADAEDEY
ncbi:hypothetical protein A2U01_0108370, partial [Trifolium medium]|nr:hypothetical protein [Trifolium medium]